MSTIFDIDLGKAVRDIAADQTIGQPIPATGQFGFAQNAQDSNRLPGHGSNPLPSAHEAQQSDLTKDDFWEYTSETIDAARWNQKFPYQLLVLNASNDGYTRDSNWEFTLPIPPESLTISTPFAISTQVTLGGIVEEHNGAPIRMISFSGTTGVLPNRETAAAGTGVPDAQRFTGGILGGFIQNVVQTAQTTAQALGFTQYNLMSEADLNSSFAGTPGVIGTSGKGRGTGYYQFMLLQRFLEAYVNLKKHAEGRHKRLAVAMWKDQAVYLVSPQSFDMRRSATDPLAYSYSLQFKAWRRVKLNDQPSALENYQSRRNDPTFLQNVLNVISEARAVLENSKTALEAIRGDASALFEPLRQTELMCKDALGLVPVLSDLPGQIAKDAARTLLERPENPEARAGAKSTAGARDRDERHRQETLEFKEQVDELERAAQEKALASSKGRNPNASASTAQKLVNNPADNYSFASQINVRKLQLHPATRKQIQDELTKVRLLQRADFEKMRDQVSSFAADFAASVGAGSDTFDSIYARPQINQTKEATDEDFDVMYAMNNVLVELSRLAISGQTTNAKVQAIEYVAGLNRRSGIAFQEPASKFAIPFPYGSTLEMLASRYLGSPNRWPEIAALNGLRSPYIDEVGFELPLLTNGRDNEFVVGDDTNLYVGQVVFLVADNIGSTKRRIRKIVRTNPSMVMVSVDGDADMGNYITMANARLHAYMPDTVNSQMMLYIPSQRPVVDELTSKAIPGLDSFNGLLDVGGVDLLLTPTGDAAIGPDGDWKLAIGLNNLVQRVRIALATPKGSLPQHPDFGLGLQAGMSTADLSAKQLLEATKSMFAADPDFAGVFSASVAKNGPSAKLSISVGVTGQDVILPVSFDLT